MLQLSKECGHCSRGKTGSKVQLLYTGGPRIVRIQTVRFHYSAENFLVPSIRFYTEISAIPRYSAIFS